MNIAPLLVNFKRYISLTAEEETIILSKVRLRKYLKGQYVLQQGDVSLNTNFVVKGCLKYYHVDPNGQEHIVQFAIEDWWIGDLDSFFTQTPSSFNIQCLEHCEVAQISFIDLDELYHMIPKLERFWRIVILKAYGATQRRLVNNFSLPAKERYLQFRKQYPKIDQRVPQYLIASYLGITKEFLSKIRSQLIHEQ